MIGHMGLAGLECENTNASFVAAGNRSYFGIEADVHMTADGKFVIIHDDNTKRVSGVDSVIKECTYEELKEIRLYDLRRGPYAKETRAVRSDLTIPLLSEYIKICKKYSKKAVLELKDHMTTGQILEMIKEIAKNDYLREMIFISFNWENLAVIQSIRPEPRIQFLTYSCDDALIEKLKQNKIDLDIEYSNVTLDLVQKLHKNQIEINCWTCDDKMSGEELTEYGVDYLTTNILEGQAWRN